MYVSTAQIQRSWAALCVLTLVACGGQPSEDTLTEVPTWQTAPALIFTSPASPANANSFSANGAAMPGATVDLYSDASCSTFLGTGTADTVGAFSISLTSPDDATTALYARQTTADGTSSCSSSPLLYVEDSSALAPTLSSFSPVSPSNSNTPNVIGTTEAGATVSLFADAGCSLPLGSGSANGSGSFSVGITVPSDTTTNVFGQITDLAGNSSTCSATSIAYLEDSQPPNVPNLTSVAPNGPANNNSPVINGSADANTTVLFFSNAACSTQIGSGSSDGAGTIAYNLSVADNTTTTIYAATQDQAGNVSACSSTFVTYIEDSIGPAINLTSTTPIGPANNNNPMVNGTTDPNTSFTLYSDSACTTSIATGTSDGAGVIAQAITVGDNSTTAIYAQGVDGIGNLGPCSSTPLNYVEDSAPPATPILLSTSPGSPSNSNTPNVIGTAEAFSSIELFSDATCSTSLAVGTASSTGSFGINISVASNSTTPVYGQATDAAGNISACSSTFVNYAEDSLAPAAPLFTSTSPTGPANDNNPTINGTAEANSQVALYSDAACTSALASGLAGGGGAFAIVITVANDSTTIVYGRATDGAGNSSACSATSITYVEDSNGPSTPILTGTSPLSPANNNSPTVNGTADVNANIELFSDAACTISIGTGLADGGGNFSIGISVADNSTTSIYGRASDDAGNDSACSTPALIYVEDSIAPSAPVLTSTTPLGPANNDSPTVNGTAEANATIQLYSDAACTTPLASGSASAGGVIAIVQAVSDDSTTNLYATATDAAGNTSPCSTPALAYVEDSTPPAIPVISGTTPHLRSDLQAATIDGTAEASATIGVFSDAACTTPVGTGTASGGNFNVAITAPLDEVVTYYATATDAAGNASACSSTSANYEAYSIPSGVGFFVGTRTVANTNFNQASASPLQYTTADFDSAYYTHSILSNTEQITVNMAGDYLISLNLPATGAVTSGALRAVVRVNGVEQTHALSQSYYTSNSNGHRDSSLQFSALLEGLNVNDVVDISVVQVSTATGTISISGQFGVYMEYIAPSRVAFAATATRTTNSTNLNQGTAYDLQWAHGRMDSGFTHSNSTNTQNITLDAVGTYLVHVNMPMNGAVTNAAVKMIIELNGTPLADGQARQGYISNSTGHREASLHWSGLVTTTAANQVLTVATQQEAAAGTVTVESGFTGSIFLERLSSTGDIFFGKGTRTVASTNMNSTTAGSDIQWATQSLYDGSRFIHSTSSNSHQVTVVGDGDYLLMANAMHSGACTRCNQDYRVKINGTVINGAQAQTFFIRNTSGHGESSGTLVFLLRRLNDGDIVSIDSKREAATGTVTGNNSSLVLIHKPY